jgi:diguanylate cyclase (GGDEF)-like protein/PAS domain S-box-containing protein
MLRIWFPLVDLAAGAVHLAVAVHVASLDKRSKPIRLFGLFAVALTAWALLAALYTIAPDRALAALLHRISGPFWISLPALLLGFALELTETGPSARSVRLRRVGKAAAAAVAAAFLLRLPFGTVSAADHQLTAFGWAEVPDTGPWGLSFVAYYLLASVASIGLVHHWARRERGTAPKQARVIIGTGVMALLCLTLAERVVPEFTGPLPPPGPVILLLWTVGIAYAVRRHRFMGLTAGAAASDILRAMSDGVLLVSNDGIVRVANQAAARLLAQPAPSALVGRPVRELAPDSSDLFGLSDDLAARHSHYGREMSVQAADGTRTVLTASVIVLRDADGDCIGAGFILHDLTAERSAQQQLHQLATHDALTGLLNRLQLEQALSNVLARARRAKKPAGVLQIDLDHFKEVNDTLGHRHGDLLLCEVARRLREQVRESDIVARHGGDEFLVVLSELASPDDAGVAASRILTALAAPVVIGDHELQVTGSIGIAVFPTDGDSVESLMQRADIAMYRAKEQRNTLAFFTAPLQQAVMKRIALESGLRVAIERGELELVYLPQFELATGRVSGLEALLRWNHPEWGTLSAGEFLPAAERIGLWQALGDWVLDKACAAYQRWQRMGAMPLPVAVNLFARQLHRPDLRATVERILEQSGVASRSLQLEISEGKLDDERDITPALQELRTLGVRLVLDNFGAGGSSLGRLVSFPFDGVKLDRGMLASVTTDGASALLVRSIIALAHSRGMHVVATGVETVDQLAFLRAGGGNELDRAVCDGVQGFLLSVPLRAEAVPHLLADAGPGLPLRPR